MERVEAQDNKMVNMEEAKKAALDLLPGLDTYLSVVLAREHLSSSAEQKRKYYVERLDVLKFTPPSLPPRPDDLPKVSRTISNNTQNNVGPGHQRELLHNGRDEEYQDGDNIYDPIDGGLNQLEQYEVPMTADHELSHKHPHTAHIHRTVGDSDGDDSATDYESYSDENDSPYVNGEYSPDRDNVPLPTVKRKREEIPISSLTNVTATGELWHKGKWKYTKRFCIISDHRLLVYKRDKDPRHLLKLPLIGYDCVYIEKEGRREHMIRISHPGVDTHWFSADLKEIADYWIEHLNAGALATGAPVAPSTDSVPTTDSAGIPADQQSTSTSNLSSEGGSGDGVVSEAGTAQDGDKRGRKKSKLGDSISSFLSGTFGKKKTDKLRKLPADFTTDPDADISNFLDVTQDVESTNKKWQQKWCVVKNGRFYVFPDPLISDPEVNFTLAGVQIDTAGKTTKKDLSVKLSAVGQDPVYIDIPDAMEHGKWLSALLKGRQHQPSATAETEDGIIYENEGIGLSAVDDEDNIYSDVGDPSLPSQTGSGTGIVGFGKPQGTTEVATKPPLPMTDPPKRPGQGRRKRDQGQGQGDTSSGDMNDLDLQQDGSDPQLYVNIEEEVASAFSQIKTKMETGRKEEKDSPVGSRKSQVKTAPAKVVNYTIDPTPAEVVKCHTGATIDEDKELFQATKNPILISLRKERKEGKVDKETLTKEADELKKKLDMLKKRKSNIRSQALSARPGEERRKLDQRLQNLDNEVERVEQEITRISLLAQDKETDLSRNSSIRSTSSTGSDSTSRSNSFNRNSPRVETERTTSHGKASPRLLRAASESSPQGARKVTGSSANTRILRKQVSDTRSGATTKLVVEERTSITTNVRSSSAAAMSKSWARSSASVSNTTKQAISQLETSSPSERATTSSDKSQLIKSSYQTGIRQGNVSNSPVKKSSNGESNSKRQSCVKDKLKMWESISERTAPGTSS